MFIFIGMYTFKEDMFYSSEYRTLSCGSITDNSSSCKDVILCKALDSFSRMGITKYSTSWRSYIIANVIMLADDWLKQWC